MKQFGNNAWIIDCCRELASVLDVNSSKLTSLQPAMFVAINNPSHFSRGLEEIDGVEPVDDDETNELANIKTNSGKANDNLSYMLCKPPGIPGEEVFNHQVQLDKKAYSNKIDDHKISGHLM